MRVYDNGCFYTVTVSEREVESFAARWPGFGSCRAMQFVFDKRSGDLVDLAGGRDCDGSGVAALSQDAQAYGQKRLDL